MLDTLLVGASYGGAFLVLAFCLDCLFPFLQE